MKFFLGNRAFFCDFLEFFGDNSYYRLCALTGKSKSRARVQSLHVFFGCIKLLFLSNNLSSLYSAIYAT